MTPADHAQYIRQLEFKLEKADRGMGMPRDPAQVLYLRGLIEQARKECVIAAAPDLLAALRKMTMVYRFEHGNEQEMAAWEQARAAISKAEGTS